MHNTKHLKIRCIQCFKTLLTTFSEVFCTLYSNPFCIQIPYLSNIFRNFGALLQEAKFKLIVIMP